MWPLNMFYFINRFILHRDLLSIKIGLKIFRGTQRKGITVREKKMENAALDHSQSEKMN